MAIAYYMVIEKTCVAMILNQVRVGYSTGLLKLLLFVKSVCMRAWCVCPSLRLLITSSIIWTQYDWLAKFYSLYIVAIVTIIISVALQLKGIVEIKTKEQASTV